MLRRHHQRPDVREALAVGAEHAQRHVGDHVAQQRLCEIDALEQSQRLVVHAHGTRVLDDLALALDDHGVDAVGTEQVGQGNAVGPATDDGNGVPAHGCAAHALLPRIQAASAGSARKSFKSVWNAGRLSSCT